MNRFITAKTQYYLKNFLLIITLFFLVDLVYVGIVRKTILLDFVRLDYSQFVFMYIFIVLIPLNYIFKQKLNHILRLLCLFYFSNTLFMFVSYFHDIFSKNSLNIPVSFSLVVTFIPLIAITITAYYLQCIKFEKKDILWFKIFFYVLIFTYDLGLYLNFLYRICGFIFQL